MTDGARPGGNLTGMAAEREPSEYKLRLEARVCTERGCKNDPAPDSDACTSCLAKRKARQRNYRKRKRQEWSAAGLCRYDGNPRAPGAKVCHACLVKRGRTPIASVYGGVYGQRDRAKGWDERAEGDGYQRRRYRGRMKRGRQSTDDLDNQDLRDAKKHLDHGIEGLAYFRTDEVQALPRVQREEVKRAALAELDRARRWIADVEVRHRYIGPSDGNDDD